MATAVAATGTDTNNGLSYIGNDDYRGYLNYLSQNGDQNAGNLLNFVGNDGNFQNGSNFMAPLSGAVNGANAADYAAWSTPVVTPSNTTNTTGTSIADSIAALTDANSQDQQQVNNAQVQLANGKQQIQDDYNKNLGRANQDQTTAQQNYDQQRQQTTTDKQNAVDNIYANGNTLANSLRRIIGMASGVNSTAYQQAAPEAIARDMTTKLTNNNDTYKKNYDAIDQAQNDTNTNFARYIQDLADEQKQKQSGLEDGILQTEQKLYGDMAGNSAKIKQLQGGTYLDGKAAAADSIAKANATQDAINQLFSQYRTPYTAAPVTPTTATTASYTPTTTTINGGVTPATSVDVSPYAAALKKIFGQGA